MAQYIGNRFSAIAPVPRVPPKNEKSLKNSGIGVARQIMRPR